MKVEINLSWGRVLFTLIGTAIFWVIMYFCADMAPYSLWALTLTFFVSDLIINQIFKQSVNSLKSKLGKMKRSTYRWKLTFLWIEMRVGVMLVCTVFYFACYYIYYYLVI